MEPLFPNNMRFMFAKASLDEEMLKSSIEGSYKLQSFLLAGVPGGSAAWIEMIKRVIVDGV